MQQHIDVKGATARQFATAVAHRDRAAQKPRPQIGAARDAFLQPAVFQQ